MPFIIAGFLMATARPGASQSVGLFEDSGDVGNVESPGSAAFDSETQEYAVRAPEGGDAVHMTWRRLSGDFIVRAEGPFGDDEVEATGDFGWMVRESLDPDAAYVGAVVQDDGAVRLQYRRNRGGSVEDMNLANSASDILQLEREGNSFILTTARRGDEFGEPATQEVDLGTEVYAGLFAASSGEGVPERRFRNVRIVVPPGEDFEQYDDFLGSNLEIMDVDTGHRKILFRSDQSLQAPNWTLDGRALIYNSNGLLYRFDLETREPSVIDTDFATRNNNDHVISFDGTMLGISHHPEEHDGQSIIYTVPITGGTPKKVTDKGPSYLHGWSPDGRYLTYTGRRDGEYDIYVIPAEGGEEIRLTEAEGLDDGSEYSPDGQYIYFNSVRTGSMEIWRMRPDGSEQEQLTDDDLNNWFPHISPDGSRMVFLSYGQDVAPDDHPFYKKVYLRMMPVDGGEPEVIAYLFGGQGTINVPSWSPDGRRIAFVSNTDLPIESRD